MARFECCGTVNSHQFTKRAKRQNAYCQLIKLSTRIGGHICMCINAPAHTTGPSTPAGYSYEEAGHDRTNLLNIAKTGYSTVDDEKATRAPKAAIASQSS